MPTATSDCPLEKRGNKYKLLVLAIQNKRNTASTIIIEGIQNEGNRVFFYAFG
jgi:hypothetical protein